MTQILGVVQPGSRGCVPCAGLPPSLIVGAGGQRGPYSVRCHYQTIFREIATAIPARTARPVHVPFMFHECFGVPVRMPTVVAGADFPGIGRGVFMVTMVGGGASS